MLLFEPIWVVEYDISIFEATIKDNEKRLKR